MVDAHLLFLPGSCPFQISLGAPALFAVNSLLPTGEGEFTDSQFGED